MSGFSNGPGPLGANRTLWTLLGANLASTADQAFSQAFPFSKFVLDKIVVTNASGTTNSADVIIGATGAVASGTGTVVCKYANSNTGALTIGLNLSTIAASPCTFTLPTGWFFAVRQTAGTVTITSAFDQSVG